MAGLVGRRVPDNTPWETTEAGDYGRQDWMYEGTPDEGTGKCQWWIRDPTGTPGNVSRHTVTEHEDGTITVEPSIRTIYPVDGKATQMWHGFLRRGVWTDA